MSTNIPTLAQVEYLREEVTVFVADTPAGPVIVWCDQEGDWWSTRVPTEDDLDVLPAAGTTYGVSAGIDPYDPASLEDVIGIPWAEGDSRALADVAAERRTHHARGWTARLDDARGVDHLVRLADRSAHRGDEDRPGYYSREGLVKAASLLLAAIDCLDRTEADRG